MSDFILHDEANFKSLQSAIIHKIQANALAWGIPSVTITALLAKQTAWTTASAMLSYKNCPTLSDFQSKEKARKDYEDALYRFVAKWFVNNSKVPKSNYESLEFAEKKRETVA